MKLSKPKVSKTGLRAAIIECGGVVADIAKAFDVSRQTVYNWLAFYEMRDELEKHRASFVAVAEDVLYDAVMGGDLDIAKFVVERLGKGKWSKRTEHTAADGENLFALSPDALRQAQAMGLDMSEVAKQFEILIQMAAAQAEVEHEVG